MFIYKYILRGGATILLPLAKIAFTKLLDKGRGKLEQISIGQNSEKSQRKHSLDNYAD